MAVDATSRERVGAVRLIYSNASAHRSLMPWSVGQNAAMHAWWQLSALDRHVTMCSVTGYCFIRDLLTLWRAAVTHLQTDREVLG